MITFELKQSYLTIKLPYLQVQLKLNKQNKASSKSQLDSKSHLDSKIQRNSKIQINPNLRINKFTRFWELDVLRGIAIIMMIIFHFLWDLNFFGFIQLDLYSGFFGLFQKATAGLFLLLVGMMLAITSRKYKEGNYPLQFVRRAGVIFSAALLVSLVTYVFVPDLFIYFGILHLIGVSIILGIIFARTRLIALASGVILIILPVFVDTAHIGIDFLVWVGLAAPRPTIDFTPIIPWFGAVLIGIFLANWLYPNAARRFNLKQNNSMLSRMLGKMGRRSLLIYLIHQPMLILLIIIFKPFF